MQAADTDAQIHGLVEPAAAQASADDVDYLDTSSVPAAHDDAPSRTPPIPRPRRSLLLRRSQATGVTAALVAVPPEQRIVATAEPTSPQRLPQPPQPPMTGKAAQQTGFVNIRGCDNCVTVNVAAVGALRDWRQLPFRFA